MAWCDFMLLQQVASKFCLIGDPGKFHLWLRFQLSAGKRLRGPRTVRLQSCCLKIRNSQANLGSSLLSEVAK